jgi:ribosomal protein S18 acetylase RimI-like enzyme
MTSTEGGAAVTVRPAAPADAPRVATLHAASWRAHYRGALRDAYLDGPIEAERAAVWNQRLAHPRAGQIVLLAEAGPVLAGFVCVFLDHDRQFGTLIDNLHVDVARKRGGIGRLLMREAGQAMLHAVPRRPAYLFVIEANHAARAFYDRIEGHPADRGRHTEPDGSEVPVLRYTWDSPAALVAGASG